MAKNITAISHKKSNVKTNGKPYLPSPSALIDGEIAINYAENVETISIKNDSGNVVTFSSDNYYTEQKLGSGFTGANSAKTVTDVILEDEEVMAAALNDLQANKLDASAYTPTDLSNYYTKSQTSGASEISTALGNKVDTSAYTEAISGLQESKLDVSAYTENNETIAAAINYLDETIEEKTKVTAIALNDLNERIENTSEGITNTQSEIDALKGQNKVTAAALNYFNDSLGGVKILRVTQEQYNELASRGEIYDETMYVIYQEHDYVEIGGIKWATMNIGATAVTDSGLYFAWGETQGYTADQVSGNTLPHKCFGWGEGGCNNYIFTPNGIDWDDDPNFGITKYNETDGRTVLSTADDAARKYWGKNWRMPTTEEFQALGAAVNTAWTTDYQGTGVSGLVCTDKTDSSKVLFFPAAGFCYNGSVGNVGSHGYYWSSSLNTSMVSANKLSFTSGGAGWNTNNERYDGFLVRGVVC
jgi:hypothetical protein